MLKKETCNHTQPQKSSMKNGYKIQWTNNALNELSQTIEYLKENFTEKEIRNLALKVENTTKLIAQNPDIFPKSDLKKIYKAVILKYNTLYYRINGNNVKYFHFSQT